MAASFPVSASMSSCFSARSYSPVKQSSSKRKVRRLVSVGSFRNSAPSACTASSSFPAWYSSREFMDGCAPALAARLRLEVVLRRDRAAEGPVRLLLLVVHLDLGIVKRDLLNRLVLGATDLK